MPGYPVTVNDDVVGQHVVDLAAAAMGAVVGRADAAIR